MVSAALCRPNKPFLPAKCFFVGDSELSTFSTYDFTGVSALRPYADDGHNKHGYPRIQASIRVNPSNLRYLSANPCLACKDDLTAEGREEKGSLSFLPLRLCGEIFFLAAAMRRRVPEHCEFACRHEARWIESEQKALRVYLPAHGDG